MAQTLEQRLATLEKLVSGMLDCNTLDMTNEQMDDAKVMAIQSIVAELAIRAGLTPDEFDRHYETRVRWWHDFFLRRAEDVAPARAAEIDRRTPEQADVSETYPPLFDSPPPDKTP